MGGTFFLDLWFGIIAIFAFACTNLMGWFPEIFYRLIECFGIVSLLDPIVTAIEGGLYYLIEDEQKGDIYRLYNYFEERESSGTIGIIMHIFIYGVLVGAGSFLFYNYFLYVHMNGRLLDNYMRLNSSIDNFFVPHDGEVSSRYLSWVCYKARNYQNNSGQSRKVVVREHEFEEPMEPELDFHAFHVIIYNVGADASRTIYRHFVKMPTGAITELSARGGTLTSYISEYLED